jgi:hypothetical protein
MLIYLVIILGNLFSIILGNLFSIILGNLFSIILGNLFRYLFSIYLGTFKEKMNFIFLYYKS